MKQQSTCGAVLTGWRIQPLERESPVPTRGRTPSVWAASAEDATRAWYAPSMMERPAHDVLTGGAAAEILMHGACSVAGNE